MFDEDIPNKPTHLPNPEEMEMTSVSLKHTCIECSHPFQNSDLDLQNSWSYNGLPVGTGICGRCLVSGPAPGRARRNWDMAPDEEQLEYGVNAHEITADRIALGVGEFVKEHPKTKWHEGEFMRLYIYLRGWQNTLAAKISRGETGFMVKVTYRSVSHGDYLGGWISSIGEGDDLTVTRRPTKKEVETAKKKNKTIPKTITRTGLRFSDLAPPALLERDRPLPRLKKCNGSCGLLHTELTPGKERGWGGHYANGLENMFCKSCLPEIAIPETAGAESPNFHIGFCRPEFCGCWSCSASDLRNNRKHKCGECLLLSCDGWIDRKTGDDTWFCRGCWINYYDGHKLVRLCDIDKTSEDTSPPREIALGWGWSEKEISDSKEANQFDGIWIKKGGEDQISPKKVEAVKMFHKCYQTQRFYFENPGEAYFKHDGSDSPLQFMGGRPREAWDRHQRRQVKKTLASLLTNPVGSDGLISSHRPSG
jgi:hypothetical protein